MPCFVTDRSQRTRPKSEDGRDPSFAEPRLQPSHPSGLSVFCADGVRPASQDVFVATERIPVAPEVIEWARQTARLDAQAAAKKLGVSEETLSKWESGDQQPTIKQLRKASKVYGRPLAVLLLADRPSDFDALRDYRSYRLVEEVGTSPALATEIRRAQTQREVIAEIAEFSPGSVPESIPLPEISADADAEEIGTLLRGFLGFEEDTPRSTGDGNDSLRAWITAVESRGIIVIHTRRVPTGEVGGFSISEFPYPVIAVNGSDWPRQRLFTLAHELAHLVLNLGGVCDLHEYRPEKRRRPEDDLEARCNAIAAATLMPSATVLNLPAVRTLSGPATWELDDLRDLSRPLGVSAESFLLRLITLVRATWDLYHELRPALRERYDEAQEDRRQRQRESEGGPSYYRVKARDLGHGYISSVLDAYANRSISSLDAADYLDVKHNQLPKLEAEVA